jgi:hypothetical protein
MQYWQIEWGHGAKATLLFLPRSQAEKVDAAVQRFARTGTGRVEWMGSFRRHARLRVPPFVIEFELDAEAGVLWVWRLTRG